MISRPLKNPRRRDVANPIRGHEGSMRGIDSYNESLFSTVRPEEFVPQTHPLRLIRTWMNETLSN